MLSKDGRERTVKGVPASEPSESPIVLARENKDLSLERCWSVDRRRDEVRLGTVAKGLNGGVVVVVVFGNNIASFSRSKSAVFESSGVCVTLSLSNMLKSAERFTAWTLRRFAEGLPLDARSKFIMPSLRFMGLTAEYEPNVPLRRFSTREAEGRVVDDPSIHTVWSLEHAPGAPPISSGKRLIPGMGEEFSTPGVTGIS